MLGCVLEVATVSVAVNVEAIVDAFTKFGFTMSYHIKYKISTGEQLVVGTGCRGRAPEHIQSMNKGTLASIARSISQLADFGDI